MIKKIQKNILIFVMILLNLNCVGCLNKDNGILYNLDEAYYLGKLSYDNLDELANYHNNKIQCNNTLDKKMELKIINTYIKQYSKNKNVSDYSIRSFYGKYNQAYVVILKDKTKSESVMYTKKIANIEFTYESENEILIYCKEKMSSDEKIKLEYVKQKLINYYPMANINDVYIEKHYGTYGKAEVVILETKYYEYAAVISAETILNYVFVYSNNNCALVFYENSFYTLKEAYRNNILTTKHLNKLIKKFPNMTQSGLEINGAPIVE